MWDLGCGTGEITEALARRWPAARVLGIDSSPEMLSRARERQGVEWVQGDIRTWEPDGPVDLIFSSAALHWVPGHTGLFPRLFSRLSPGGRLAVQMPRNFAQPSHTLLAETARGARWADRLSHLGRQAPVASPDWYHDLLRPLASVLDVWETTYLQALTGDDPVAAWTRSTAARPYLEALGSDAEAFMEEYSARLRMAYPPRPDGVTLFPFTRLFVIAGA